MAAGNDVTSHDVVEAGRRTRVSIVVSKLSPLTGLESATVSLVDAIAGTFDIRVFVLAGEVSAVIRHPSVTVESWGAKVVGWKRVVTLGRAFTHRNDMDGSVIILSGAWAAIPMLFALPKRSRMRTLVWEHSLDNHQLKINRRLAILRALARPLYARAHATVAVSDSLRHDMYNAGFRGPIEMIPNIVRKFDSAPSGRCIQGRLLTVGSLSKVKNQALALEALALLPQRFSLDIVGDGPERPNLERLAAELGVADRVSFHGYVSDPAEHFAQAQFVIHPSHSETYGLVLFEAADFCTPVIAANRGVMAEVIPRLAPGVVAEPQPQAFADAVLSLETTPVSEQDFAAAAGRRASTAKHIVRDWNRLICETAD